MKYPHLWIVDRFAIFRLHQRRQLLDVWRVFEVLQNSQGWRQNPEGHDGDGLARSTDGQLARCRCDDVSAARYRSDKDNLARRVTKWLSPGVVMIMVMSPSRSVSLADDWSHFRFWLSQSTLAQLQYMQYLNYPVSSFSGLTNLTTRDITNKPNATTLGNNNTLE